MNLKNLTLTYLLCRSILLQFFFNLKDHQVDNVNLNDLYLHVYTVVIDCGPGLP